MAAAAPSTTNCLTDYLCGDDEFTPSSPSNANTNTTSSNSNAYEQQMTANIQRQLDEVADNSAYRTALEEVAGEQYEQAYYVGYNASYAKGEENAKAVAALIAASFAARSGGGKA